MKVHLMSIKLLHQYIEDFSLIYPDKIAIICSDSSLTYQELNERSNQLAHLLISQYYIKSGSLVVICIERSELSIVAILAVMKAGAAYIVIEQKYCSSEYIISSIERINPIAIICDYDSENSFVKYSKLVINYHECNLDDYSKNNLINRASINDIACVFSTSGTTGTPKLIPLSYYSIINKIQYLINAHNISSGYKILSKTSFSFDPSLREIFLAFASGACLVIANHNEIVEPKSLLNILIEEQVNVALFVPSHLSVFVEFIESVNYTDLSKINLKLLYCCGEALNINLVKRLFRLLPDIVVKNQYGPTEACMFSFEFHVDKENINKLDKIPIGKPILDIPYLTKVENSCASYDREIFELYIGGKYLSNGYLNEESLTKKYFQIVDNKVYYKTGDLVRVSSNGNFEYICRKDHQIKINGHRVELYVIESLLNRFFNFTSIAALGFESKIFLFYVSEYDINTSEFTRVISSKLPSYYIPNNFIRLNNFPLSANGKLDRNKLLSNANRQYVNSTIINNTLEYLIQKEFANVLNVAVMDIGINDDFFLLGGNSLLAMKLMVLLNKATTKKYTVNDIYKYRTVNNLAFLPDNLNSFFEEENFYYSSTVFKQSIVFIPGLFTESRFILLAKKFLADFNVYILKEIKNEVLLHRHVDKYSKLIEQVIPDGGITLVGYSAAGFTACKLASYFENIRNIQIILLDSNLSVFNYYHSLIRYFRYRRKGLYEAVAIFNRSMLPNSPILFFNAEIKCEMNVYDFPIFKDYKYKYKFRKLRQIKAILMSIIDKVVYSFKIYDFQNVVKINCNHSEILNPQHVEFLENKIRKFIALNQE